MGACSRWTKARGEMGGGAADNDNHARREVSRSDGEESEQEQESERMNERRNEGL